MDTLCGGEANARLDSHMKSEGDTKSLSQVEMEYITKVLSKVNGEVTKAAKILGISRTCLYSKMRVYQIPINDLRKQETA